MNAKKAGILFCAIVLSYTTIELLLTFTRLGGMMGVEGSLVVSELIMIVPCLIAFLACKEPFAEVFGVKKVHPVLIPLSIVLTWTVLPLITCCNAFTMYFVENEAAAIFDSLSELPLPLVALFSSVIAPVCEEWTFRGILYTGFRKNGSAFQAILLTAVLFGMFHMNLNQMVYAMVLGIFFAILREVTGSIVPSIICHMTVNGGSTIMMFLEADKVSEVAAESADVLNAESISMLLCMLIPIAALATALALGLLIKIAKTQKALPKLQNIVEGRVRDRGKVVNKAVILGMVVCIIFVMLPFILGVLGDVIPWNDWFPSEVTEYDV